MIGHVQRMEVKLAWGENVVKGDYQVIGNKYFVTECYYTLFVNNGKTSHLNSS